MRRRVFCIFHAVICSHLFWKAVLVFRGKRIFLHSCLTIELCLSRFLPLLSKQVRPGMLSVKFLGVGVVLASVFSLLWLLCFKLQRLCLTAVLQHSGEQPRQSVCAADHSKVRSAADEVWLSSPHSHTQHASSTSTFVSLLNAFSTPYTCVFLFPLSCSFPDVMMPAYSKNRWSCVFFIVYLSIELYFIMNLVQIALQNVKPQTLGEKKKMLADW